jgi:N-formylglutamate deformylase
MRARLPILISVPHGGTTIPPEVADRIRLTARDVLGDSDTFTCELYDFRHNVAAFIENPIARAVVDVNRAPDDRPPKNPDGVIKTRTVQGLQVYREGRYPEEGLISTLLQTYYYPYHERVAALLDAHEVQLALDCHSMLPLAPPTKEHPGRPRPLICLSNRGDARGMPKEGQGLPTCPPEWLQILADAFRHAFAHEDGEIKLNEPFAGGYISQHHHRRTGIPWIQIELNRKLYLVDQHFEPQSLRVAEARIRELKERIFMAIIAFWASIEGLGAQ